ncbi:MAG: GNAT family N-acetyltransferase [Actinomycetota bacterium]|jgi:GNAT superfamily N-acetyltransferase|nr:GNAT family N-acetyltransferase [Actinomycetota bacterium]
MVPALSTTPDPGVEGVRWAGPDDEAVCAELCRKGLTEAQERRGGAILVRREADLAGTALLRPGGLRRLMSDPGRLAIVGTVDGVVVGLLVARLDDVRGTALGVVELCYVEPEARGVGVGRALVDAAGSWATERGCRGLDVPALPGDRAAKQLLEAAGFQARALVMHRRLP